MPKICVVLSGCGVQDGGEIHESVLTLLALDQKGAHYFCVAPEMNQFEVVNHISGETMEETRNVLAESARIARGSIEDIASVEASDLDGIVFPGGFGAAKNLCSFAQDGAKAKVHPEVERLLRQVYQAKKPIGAMCIAPALLAAVFGASLHPTLTIGTDEGTAKTLESMGARHQNCAVSDCVIDEKNLMITTPAYMLAQSIHEAQQGINKLVEALLKRCLPSK
jgi:enhancing lycopene biosynthesis protein 2